MIIIISLLFIMLKTSAITTYPPHHFDYDEIHPYHFPETLYRDVMYGPPDKIIRNKRDSRYFPGHVPAGVKGITKVSEK